MHYSPSLAAEYQQLFDRCQPKPEHQAEIQQLCQRLQASQPRYQLIGQTLGIPWLFIALIHRMECQQNFKCHLHNGDPLTARTRQVPANRPPLGNPPFSWEQSAADALILHQLHFQPDWSLTRWLYRLENYNGWGYRQYHKPVLSPYLWSYSNLYQQGKYLQDGKWSATAVSRQSGTVILLKTLLHQDKTLLTAPQVSPPHPLPQYARQKPKSLEAYARARQLQLWLNQSHGTSLQVDGICGRATSDAYQAASGDYLTGDPRQSSRWSA